MAAVTAALRLGEVARARSLLEEAPQVWLRPGERRSEMGYLYNLAIARPAR